MESSAEGPRYEFIIRFINRYGLISDQLILLHYTYCPEGWNGWEEPEFKHELLMSVATLAITDIRYLKYFNQPGCKPTEYITPYITATFLSHMAYSKGYSFKYNY